MTTSSANTLLIKKSSDSLKYLSSFLNNRQEWRSFEDVMLFSINSLCDILSNQNQILSDMDQNMNSKVSHREFESIVSSKVNRNEYISTLNVITKNMNPLNPPLLDQNSNVPINENDLNYQSMQSCPHCSHGSSNIITDIQIKLAQKADLQKTNAQINMIDDKLNQITNELNKKLPQFASCKDISKLANIITSKVGINELNNVVSGLSTRDELINGLRGKANVTDMQQMLKGKIDITEYNSLLNILSSKVTREEIDKMYELIGTKVDKEYLEKINDALNNKVDLANFNSFLNEEYTINRTNLEKKLDELDKDFDNLISNIKLQFKNVSLVINKLDNNKVELSELEKITNDLLNKINEENVIGTINKFKFDTDNMIKDFKQEVFTDKQNYEEIFDNKIKIEMSENKKDICKLNNELNYNNENIKRLNSINEDLRKSYSELNSKFTFICSENSSKFNKIFEILNTKLDNEDYIKSNVQYKEELTHFYQDTLDKKASNTQLEEVYQSFQVNLSNQISSISNEMNKNHDECTRILNKVSYDYENNSTLINKLKEKIDQYQDLLKDKASKEQIELINSSLKNLNNTLIDKIDYKKFNTFTKDLNDKNEEIINNILKKADNDEIDNKLNEKVSLEQLNNLDEKISTNLKDKLSIKKFDKILGKQNDINESICNGNAIGKWTWTSKKFKNGFNIPWENERINTLPSNFFWEKDKTTIMISEEDFYCIIVCIFTDNPATVANLIINGDYIAQGGCDKEEQGMQDFQGDKKIIKTCNLHIEKFIKINEKARVSVEIGNYNGGEIEGFIIIKRN